MNVYDTANRLAGEIKNSEEYVNFKMARQAINLNTSLKEKMNVNKPITSHIYNAVLENPRYKQYARQGTVKMKSMNERWKR